MGLLRGPCLVTCARRPRGSSTSRAAPETGSRRRAPGEAFAELASKLRSPCQTVASLAPAALDDTFLLRLRRFLDAHGAAVYSEHLSACGDSLGHLYDLLPLPFSDEAVHHVSARIRQAQDALGRRIAVENISYYATVPGAAGAAPPLTELEFVNAVLAEADCDLCRRQQHHRQRPTTVDAAGSCAACRARAWPTSTSPAPRRGPDLNRYPRGGGSDPVWRCCRGLCPARRARPCSNATSISRRSTAAGRTRRGAAATSPTPAARHQRPEMHAEQEAFAAHIRDPDRHPPPPGVDPRRMQVYRDLFFNNVSRLLAGNFPVIRRIRGDAWPAMVRRFYREHGCRTPLFPEIPREFLRWLEDSDGHEPWLAELAHYEWVELALQVSEATADDVAHDRLDAPGLDVAAALLDGRPLLSPLAWPLAYAWPVQRIGPGFLPSPARRATLLGSRAEDGAALPRTQPLVAALQRWTRRASSAGARSSRPWPRRRASWPMPASSSRASRCCCAGTGTASFPASGAEPGLDRTRARLD